MTFHQTSEIHINLRLNFLQDIGRISLKYWNIFTLEIFSKCSKGLRKSYIQIRRILTPAICTSIPQGLGMFPLFCWKDYTDLLHLLSTSCSCATTKAMWCSAIFSAMSRSVVFLQQTTWFSLCGRLQCSKLLFWTTDCSFLSLSHSAATTTEDE